MLVGGDDCLRESASSFLDDDSGGEDWDAATAAAGDDADMPTLREFCFGVRCLHQTPFAPPKQRRRFTSRSGLTTALVSDNITCRNGLSSCGWCSKQYNIYYISVQYVLMVYCFIGSNFQVSQNPDFKILARGTASVPNESGAGTSSVSKMGTVRPVHSIKEQRTPSMADGIQSPTLQ